MASSGKKKTTMAKLSRESRLRERRVEKKARKEARKLAASQPDRPDNELGEYDTDRLAGDLDTDGATREADGDERNSEVAAPTREPEIEPERELASPPAQTAGE